MAETEISKEVPKTVAVEDERGLDLSSFQDLPKPDCNGNNHNSQPNDLDNSYVFVSGADGIPDDIGNKDVETEGLRVLPESDAAGVELHSQIDKIDSVNGEFQPLNEGEKTVVDRSNGDPPLDHVNSKDGEAEGLSVMPESDAPGVKDQRLELHSQKEKSDAVMGKFKPLKEEENSVIEPSNGGPPSVNVNNKVVDTGGLSVLPGSSAGEVEDQEEKLHFQIEKIDAVSGLNVAENNTIEQSGGDPPLVNFDNKDVEDDGLGVLPESARVKDQGAEVHFQIVKTDVVTGDFQPPNEAVNNNMEQIIEDLSVVNVDNKDVEAEGLSILSESSAAGLEVQGEESHSQIGKNGVDSGEFQLLNEACDSISSEQNNGGSPLVSMDGSKDVEAESLSVHPEPYAAGINDHWGSLAVSGDYRPLNETENGFIDRRNGDPPSVNPYNEDVEAGGGLSVLPESNAPELKDQEAELHSQIEIIDAVCEEFFPPNEAENSITEKSNGNSPPKNICDKDVEAEGSSVVLEPDAADNEDREAKLSSQNESFIAVSGEFQPLKQVENRSIEQIKVDPTSVYDSTSKHESFHQEVDGVQVSIDDPLKDHAGETQLFPETEVEHVHVQKGIIESLIEVEVDKALDQNGIVENVVEGKEENFDNVIRAESSPAAVENHVSQVVALDSVVDLGKNGDSNDILLKINSSHGANGECVDESNLCIPEALGASQNMVDINVVKSVREVAEEDLVSLVIHDKVEKLEEAKTNFSSEVLGNQHSAAAGGNNVQGVLRPMDESKIVGSTSDDHVQKVCSLILEEKDENLRVSEVDNDVQSFEESNEHADCNRESHDTMLAETKSEASMQTQNYPASKANARQSELKVSDGETVGVVPFPSIECTKSQISEKLSPSNDRGMESKDEVVLTVTEQASLGNKASAEVSSGKVDVAVFPSVTVMKLEPEAHVHNLSTISGGEKVNDASIACSKEVSDSFDVNKEAANIMLNVEGTEDIVDPLDGTVDSGNENMFVKVNENAKNLGSNKIHAASAGVSGVNMGDGKERGAKIKTKPFNFLIRIPRFDDENLREQIRIAKLHVDEKTKLRDDIQVQIQEKRANSQIHGIDYEYAKSEARSARKLVRSKRMEIDSLQAVINKAKNALSIEDIDSQICNMEYMIEHETLPLKEEKQLIREINKLKQLREQLSSNMGSQDEIKQAIEQREEFEDRLKILRKELDTLKTRVLKAEATASEAEKKYDDENKRVKELQARFRAADDVRQAAYVQWQNLRKELSKKSEHFFKYKDDAAVAINFAHSRDTDALHHLCMNQVDNFMELWNTNEEFHREYVKFNTRSTVRRFGTLDGLALGPDEEPPVLPSYADERVRRMASASVKVDPALHVPCPEVKQETTKEDNKLIQKATETKHQKVTKEPAISMQASGLDAQSVRDLGVEVHEEPIRSKEEIESSRREEEKRREDADAKLKEQRRLEALVKANEARERKKRQAEKLQMRADLKIQKEAEQREKEREKRLRKKERKKAAVSEGNDMSSNGETAPSSESAAENSKETDVNDMPCVTHKKPKKPWWFGKQSKSKSIPPPLRNRNKKRLQQWMWVGLTSLMILVLFWLGNIGVFSNVALKRRGPVL